LRRDDRFVRTLNSRFSGKVRQARLPAGWTARRCQT
jgi:hypothetical protein